MLDYWLNPANLPYHKKRGTDPKLWLDAEKETQYFNQLVDTPLLDRRGGAAVPVLNDKAIGHVLLNDWQDDGKRRLHFHMWRHLVTHETLGGSIKLAQKIIRLSVEYFLATYPVTDIIGDVAVSNRPANHVLKSMGMTPSETLQASYLGEMQPYYRYRFTRDVV